MLVVQSLNNIDAILGTNALSKSPTLQSKLQRLWSVNNISPDTTVEKLLSNYDVVASSGFHKPSSKIPPITFELLDEKPVQQKSRPIPVAVFQDLQVQIKEMEQMGVIVESESPYNSPILPVKKPDGSIRMCLDFVKVNQHIRYKNLPLPLIDNIFVQLENKSVFSTMDLNKGYWQLKLSPEAQVITAFNFGVKHYQFAVLPFGLSVAPGIFQKIMQMVLKPVLEKYPTDVYIYIDDILVATSSTTLHLQILNEIFQLLQKYELKLNLKKSKFLQKEVSYLGMRLTSSGLAMSPEKLRKVMDFPIPQNKKTLLSFLGLANFLRRFLKNYTIDSKPLYDLSTQPTFTWTEQALESFQKVKKSLLEAPILTAPNFAKALDESWPFFLVTDASKIGIGAVLLQKVNGDMKIIAMFNRSLHGSEKNYPPTDLEALAISAALTHMNLILYGVPVTIITDHF
uniref:RNA-directed DNA polymerase n=1 Tax=Strongyloides papillosus TaxID=174720 RepID=A0A0N5BQJ0_STREA